MTNEQTRDLAAAARRRVRALRREERRARERGHMALADAVKAIVAEPFGVAVEWEERVAEYAI